MNVTVIGSGYVGLVTGACLSEFGVQVTCVDNQAQRIDALNRFEMPIYEPGLDELVRRNVSAGRLAFSTDAGEAIRSGLVIFIAVGTPSRDDGGTDLVFVEAVAREIGRVMDGFKVIVTKSTVPAGTSRKLRSWVQEELDLADKNHRFSVASNPEFLREGAAIGDFMRPDRVVIGTEDGDEQAMAIMTDLYRPLFLNETPFVLTNLETSELSKYAANAFLATKVSFINELAILCDRIGGDVQAVARAMGLDNRIGKKFLHAGPGYGGSCFPKDTLSAAYFAREQGVEFEIVEAAIRANERQRMYAMEKVRAACDDDFSGKTVALLGLSFKPETDDMREAPSLYLIEQLLAGGAKVRAYDPQAMAEAGEMYPGLDLAKDAYAACEEADALVIVTEWNQFRMLDLERVKSLLAEPRVVDLRNIYEPEAMKKKGFEYWSVGRRRSRR